MDQSKAMPIDIEITKKCHQIDGKPCVHKCYVKYDTDTIEQLLDQVEICKILDGLYIEVPNHFKTPVKKDLYKDKPVFYPGTANFSLYHQMKYGKQPNAKYYWDQFLD